MHTRRDVFRPLESDCSLKLCTFEDQDGKDVRAATRCLPAVHSRCSAVALLRLPLRMSAPASLAASACAARLPRSSLRLLTHAVALGAGLAQTFWHSSAHVLGEVLELTFGCDLTIGPSLEEGFYYDCFMGDRSITEEARAPAARAARPRAASPCTRV